MSDQKEPLDFVEDAARLPRLLYVGDVPVEADMQGRSLLYRLFESYPKEKLLIVEGREASMPSRRISGVNYLQYKPMWFRIPSARFHSWTLPIATLTAPAGGIIGVPKLVRSFNPQAVITVVGGWVWQAAAVYARRAQLPLHLIVHDDWPNLEDRCKVDRHWMDRQLQRWYSTAASRLCVSPSMAEEYCRRYGGPVGDVLYPSRATDGPIFTAPPKTLKDPCKTFVVAFAGSIYIEYARALQRMAIALQQFNGRLIVYGQGADKDTCPLLREPNIEMRGKVTSTELIRQCRQEAHAVFVPMSYREQDRRIMELGFPSKLADLTAVGVPLVIDGPEYCSAVRWARENPGVAEVIADNSVDALAASIARMKNPDYRLQLARVVIERGHQYFVPSRAISLLYERLSRAELNYGPRRLGAEGAPT